jgi:hypothetical protein
MEKQPGGDPRTAHLPRGAAGGVNKNMEKDVVLFLIRYLTSVTSAGIAARNW